jgi:hypothetical protein
MAILTGEFENEAIIVQFGARQSFRSYVHHRPGFQVFVFEDR